MKRLGVLIIVSLIGTLVSYSTSYAGDNTIYGCYKKNDGQLRIVNQGDPCLPSESSISWNKVGSSGSPGAPGPSGPQGPAGPAGRDGTPGVSVLSSPLKEGDDPNCPNGGSLFTSVRGVTYACNGEGTEGGTIIFNRLAAGTCGSDGYGWCPNGSSASWRFRIKDSTVNEHSVIAINVIHPSIGSYRGCEVNSIGTGEFLVLCNGWNYVERTAILRYAVFNP